MAPATSIRRLAWAACLLCLADTASAQEAWPTRPVRLIVGFAAGGSVDTVARWIAEPLSQSLGQQVLVDNRPGAGGNLGMDLVAKAPPDGYTLGVAAVGAMAINPALHGAAMPYDPVQDFVAITQLVSQPSVLTVNPQVPARTLPEFVAWLRTRTNEPYATGGIGTLSHLAGEMIKRELTVAIEHVPYRGDGPAISDLLAGQVRLLITNVTPVLPQVRDGRLRAIAVTGGRRSSVLPDVATVAEVSGRPFDMVAWQGLFGPAKLPDPIVRRLSAEVARALAQPDIRKRFEDAGTTPVGSTPEAFAAFVREEVPKWREAVRISGAKVE